MKYKLKILIAAAEVTPIAKVGGLGDVIGALPKALVKLNLDARVIVPFYGAIDRKNYKIKLIKRNIKVGAETFNLWQTRLPDSAVKVYLIEHDYFKAKEIYSTALADGDTDLEKFSFFSRAILPAMNAANFKPDVVHLNDWHVAEVAGLAKKSPENFKTILTIHNLANQGVMGKRNLLAEGIINADLLTTVSPTYAKEILTKEFGCGLEKNLTKRKNNLYGILNGIDTDNFNPATDKFIFKNYAPDSAEKKTENKLKLQKKLGWLADKNLPLAGLVSRLTWQKGLDLITKKFARLNCQFVILGQGEKKLENALTTLAKKYPAKFKVIIKFDERLARQIYSASDIFPVPSRFEPCGLTQLIAMRYGAVPLVRRTGGLADTVNDQVGFSFKKIEADEFYNVMAKALKIYREQPSVWRRLQANGLNKDFSWGKSARAYLKLYQKLAK